MLNTQWSKGKRSSPENSRYKYLKRRGDTQASVGVQWGGHVISATPAQDARNLWETHQRKNCGHADDLKHRTTCSRAARRAPRKLGSHEASGAGALNNELHVSVWSKQHRCRTAYNKPLPYFSGALLKITNTTNHVFWQLKQ